MLFEIALIAVVAVHLLAVNVAVGGPILCVVLHAREVRRGDELAGQIGRRLLRDAIVGLLVGIVFGLAAWGMVWHLWPRLTAVVIGQLPMRRYWFGLAELAFSLALLGGYAWCWNRYRGLASRWELAGMWGMCLIAWTNLAYHFPTLFAALSMVSTDHELWNRNLSFLNLISRPEAWIRVTHFLLASLAVTGLLGVVRLGGTVDTEEPLERKRLRSSLGRWSLLPTAMQLIVGVLVLMFLPQDSREALMGRSFVGSMVFLLSLVAAVTLVHKLALLTMSEVRPADVRQAVVLMLVTVVLMTGARHFARRPTVSQYELTLPANSPLE